MSSLKLIGIDCAVQSQNTGIAVGSLIDGRLSVVHAGAGSSAVIESVVRELDGGAVALLALDAPLGWPVGLGHELCAHRAGQPMFTVPNQLFRRDTV